MNLVEYIRKESIDDLFKSVTTFKKAWPKWSANINDILGPSFSARDLIELGNHLSATFILTKPVGRGQSDVSGGGSGWEALICWYLNICAIGSRLVVVKKQKLLPSPLKEAKGIYHDNVLCNSESDLVAIVFPNRNEFQNDISALELRNSKGVLIPTYKGTGEKLNYNEIMDHLGAQYFKEFEMGVIQCKTTWNDNSQIPMLWGLVYDADELKHSSFSIGVPYTP